jgi:hypothetical protein
MVAEVDSEAAATELGRDAGWKRRPLPVSHSTPPESLDTGHGAG